MISSLIYGFQETQIFIQLYKIFDKSIINFVFMIYQKDINVFIKTPNLKYVLSLFFDFGEQKKTKINPAVCKKNLILC